MRVEKGRTKEALLEPIDFVAIRALENLSLLPDAGIPERML
jgi:hypothetical protein